MERLLDKHLQVIGMDDLSTGRKENLQNVNGNSQFQFINRSVSDYRGLEFPRLDYAIFVIDDELPAREYIQALERFIKIIEPFGPKVLFVSSIDLYQSKHTKSTLKQAESRFARYASDKKANARVVRLSSVYGPRMRFTSSDPLIELIKLSLHNQPLVSQLEFSSRALYIDDAISLLMKTLFHGSTAHKIYDGALLFPVKMEEAAQVIKDPLWHDHQHFMPSLLPAWPTPNLIKTQKELSWKPSTSFITAIKQTLAYFHTHPDEVKNIPLANNEEQSGEPREEESTVVEKEEIVPVKQDLKQGSDKPSKKYIFGKDVFNQSFKRTIVITLVLSITVYALFYPFGELLLNSYLLSQKVNHAQDAMVLGEFTTADKNLSQAVSIADGVSESVDSILILRALHLLQPTFSLDQTGVTLIKNGADALYASGKGSESLNSYFKVLTGGVEGDSTAYLNRALSEFDKSEHLLGVILSTIRPTEFTASLPSFLATPIKNLEQGTQQLHQSVIQAKTAASILQRMPMEDHDYLIIWTNSYVQRAGGGQVSGVSELSFEKNKIKKIQTKSIVELEKNFNQTITPPADLAKDLQVNSWSFKDVFIEADLAANARNAEWFYQQSTGIKAAGIIVADTQTATRLLEILGPVTVQNGQKVDAGYFVTLLQEEKDNSQLLAAIYQELTNRMLYMADGEWTKVTALLGTMLQQKHIQLYFNDQNAQKYVNEIGWSKGVGEQQKNQSYSMMLAVTEDSLRVFKADIKKQLELATQIEQDKIKHDLTLAMLNQSDEGGESTTYSSRVKFYLPLGMKLVTASFNGTSIMSQISTFSDYSLAGYSIRLEVKPKEQKTLQLEFEQPKNVFSKKQTEYKALFVKAPSSTISTLRYTVSTHNSIVINNNQSKFESEQSFDQDREFTLQLSAQ